MIKGILCFLLAYLDYIGETRWLISMRLYLIEESRSNSSIKFSVQSYNPIEGLLGFVCFYVRRGVLSVEIVVNLDENVVP